MMDIDQFETTLDAIANTLPPAFYEELNGGILLLPEVKRHPKATGDDLYIMGEYHRDSIMGRYIVIYYGSFERVYGYLSDEALKKQMEKTLRHEFRHHMESRAGMRDLEIADRMQMEAYENRKK
ncbi:metallopeptidase family protein [Eubacterium sp. 1001713B170207_170306_E7]|uniref:metallopeptidase family protein n=1 Tax=Eubacterium sp. 1001713B170207_170306_E7 TaxID=2787097 RepID=UPI001899DCD3|nr:metallopeptidase family protein [Eubacterium sp. 1001713B170207_170306_E7]